MIFQNPISDPEDLFEQQKKQAFKFIEKKIKKAEKRVEERKHILEACKNWPKVHQEGLLIQANLFRIKKETKEIIVSDWEQDGAERTIHLNPLALPKDQVAAYFRRSKKLRLGLSHAERMFQEAVRELEVYLSKKQSVHEADRESLANFLQDFGINKPSLPIKSWLEKKKPAKPYHTFITKDGVEIWVGKSAKDNDKLTFHHANGLDWWMHANNHPGSHVVIRCTKGSQPNEESLNDAGELALRYSKAKNCHEEEVCLTKVNGLSSVKGIPGKVMVSKPRILRIVLDENRWHRLKKTTNRLCL